MAIPSWAGSVALHAAGIAALLLFRPNEELTIPKLAITPLEMTAPKKITAPPAAKAMGGGGGLRETKPASRGKLPRIAPLVFVQPTVKTPQIEPALAIAPAIVDAPPVQVAAIHLGDPFGVPGPPSNGRGRNGGIGDDGDGGGIGNNKGPRAGEGDGLKGAYSLGALSSAPILVHKVEPEYSDEARRARFNGSVLLRLVIDANGSPTHLEVLRSPGLGLEERALKSVSQWRFRPGRRDGKPVPVWATVEVNFSLL